MTIACSVAVSATVTASTACFATIALGNPPDPMQSAIDFANARGVPIVSVAGNVLDPTDFSPEVRAIVNFSNVSIAGLDVEHELASIGGFKEPVQDGGGTDIEHLTRHFTVSNGIAQTNKRHASGAEC